MKECHGKVSYISGYNSTITHAALNMGYDQLRRALISPKFHESNNGCDNKAFSVGAVIEPTKNAGYLGIIDITKDFVVSVSHVS